MQPNGIAPSAALYGVYRHIKSLPGVGTAANFSLRKLRKLFWSLRPADAEARSLPADFLSFLLGKLSKAPSEFVLIEIGCGDGRVLEQLARRFPDARFIGVDIGKAAVAIGRERLEMSGLTNVQLHCASVMSEAFSWECDYLISRTALIYLNDNEIRTFLEKRLPLVRRELLAHEIVSTTERTWLSHFFAHPLPRIVLETSREQLNISVEWLNYQPWRQEGRWQGAEISIARMLPVREAFLAPLNADLSDHPRTARLA